MNWFGTITLRASAQVSCPLNSMQCDRRSGHFFVVEQSAQTPLLLEEERRIREKLQQQLDEIVKKFLEVHK